MQAQLSRFKGELYMDTQQAIEHIIITANTEAIRARLHADYDVLGLELVNSSPTSIVWRWYGANQDALEAIASHTEHKGTVQIK